MFWQGKDIVGGPEEKWKLVALSDPSAYKWVSYSKAISLLDIRSPSSRIATIDEAYIWRLTGPNDFDPVIHNLNPWKTTHDSFG